MDGATTGTSLDDEDTYARVRATTTALAALLAVEEQCAPSMPDARSTIAAVGAARRLQSEALRAGKPDGKWTLAGRAGYAAPTRKP